MTIAAPELTAALDQAARLSEITGGEYHTNIGQAVHLYPVAAQEPTLNVCLGGVATTGGQRLATTVALTWVATVPITRTDKLDALLVLTDMRHALTCKDKTIRVDSTDIEDREGAYALVSITTTQTRPIG